MQRIFPPPAKPLPSPCVLPSGSSNQGAPEERVRNAQTRSQRLHNRMESYSMTSLTRRTGLRLKPSSLCVLAFLSALTVLLSGCGNFFSCEGKSECPTTGGGTGTNTGDYVYVSDSTTSNNYLNGYSPASSSLAATTNSPYNLDFIPSAIAITPTNSFMYIASESSTGEIYGYTIGTGGQPTILNSGTPLVSDDVAAMDISPDGNWLFVLDAITEQVEIYSINTSTGALTFSAPVALVPAPNETSYTPLSIKVASSGDFVVCSLGTGGANVFSFNTSSGASGAANQIIPGTAATGIYAATWDANNYLYTAGTAGLQVFTVTAAGAPTLANTYTTGIGAKSILVNSTSTDIYVGNQSDSTITGYAIGTNAALTPIAGSPFTGPTTVSALATNSTGAYLLAAGFNASNGLQLFTITSTGALTLDASAGTGTGTAAPTPVLAATH
jgi:6-phosphogluconolactonase